MTIKIFKTIFLINICDFAEVYNADKNKLIQI
jgi:hypothetical protein